MGIEIINSPPLVAAAGVASHAAFPALEKWVQDGALSWNALRMVNLFTFTLHMIAVSIPGRIDERKTTEMSTGKKSIVDDDIDNSLFTPAPWAFGIWGVIFIGELIFGINQFRVSELSPAASVIKSISIPFSMAQVFQILWTASFRPKYKGNLIYISSAMLGSITYCLSKAHAVFAVGPKLYTRWHYVLCFLPMTIHFGWVSAATLVNLNSAVAREDSSSPKLVALVGHASAIAATAAGVAVTLTRDAPVYGGVLSWALFAAAASMKSRLSTVKSQVLTSQRPGLAGAKVQKVLCAVGGLANSCTSVFIALALSGMLKKGDGRLIMSP